MLEICKAGHLRDVDLFSGDLFLSAHLLERVLTGSHYINHLTHTHHTLNILLMVKPSNLHYRVQVVRTVSCHV